MDIETEKVLEKLSCPCDSVKKLQDETNDSRVTMAKIEQKLETLCESMLELKADIKDIKENSPTNERFEKLEKRVQDLENKPVKRYDGFVNSVVSALAGGIVAFILFKLGIG